MDVPWVFPYKSPLAPPTPHIQIHPICGLRQFIPANAARAIFVEDPVALMA